MNRGLVRITLAAGLTLTAGCAPAGYVGLQREMEAYAPPAEVAVQLTPPPAKPDPPAVSPAATEFQAAIDALRQQRLAWEERLAKPPAAEVFLVPDPVILKAVGSGADDLAAVGKALANGFSLEALETLALVRNPTVRAKTAEFRAVLEGYSQAEDLDTTLRRYATLTKGVMPGVGGMSNPDPVAAKFPFPSLLALKGEIVGQEAAAAWAEVEAARREAVTAARKAYAELLYNRAARELSASLLTLQESLLGVTSTRYQAGSASFRDTVASGSERERLRTEVATLEQERLNVEASLRSLIALPAEVAIGTPAPRQAKGVTATVEGLTRLARGRRQEIAAKRAMIGQAERMVTMAETMVTPGLASELSLFEPNPAALGGSGGGAMTGGESSFPETSTAATGIGQPKTPWFGAEDGYLRAARQRIAALNQELAATRAAIGLEVREAWFRFDRALRQQTLYRQELVPLAQADLDAARQAYAAGRVDFAGFVDSARSWLNANLALARAQADALVARAELEAAVGVSREEFAGGDD